MRKKPGPRGWTGGLFGNPWLESLINLSLSWRTDGLVGIGGGGTRPEGRVDLSLSFFLIPFVKGTDTLGFAHSTPMRAKDFLVYEKGTRSGGPRGALERVFPLFFLKLHIPWG
jgi:hypothetical protein